MFDSYSTVKNMIIINNKDILPFKFNLISVGIVLGKMKAKYIQNI